MDDPENIKHIIFQGENVTLTRDPVTNFWVSDHGTIYAYKQDPTADPRDVCGVGYFSLADENPLNDGCNPHDFAYSSPVYQAFHFRSEADHYLEQLLKQIPGEQHSLTPGLFELISRQEGFHFWENSTTNN